MDKNKITITIESARTEKRGKPFQIFVNLKELSKAGNDFTSFDRVIEEIGDRIRSNILNIILDELLIGVAGELERRVWDVHHKENSENV